MYTRSGNRVEHMEASYGRAARKESKRRRLKRKLVTLAEEEDDGTAKYYDSNGEEEAADKSRTPFTPARRRTTRAQLQIEEALSTPPSASTRAATTPPSPSERLLRGRRKPMCTDYGLTRHFAFRGQGFFFCSPCDLWDDRLPDSNMKASRVSTRFGCTANHSCFSHPTSIRNEHCRSSTVRSNVAADVFGSRALNSCHSVAPNDDSASSNGGISVDDDDDDDESSLGHQFNEEKEDISGSTFSAESDDDDEDDDEDDASTSSRNTAGNIMMPTIVRFNGNNQPGAALPVDDRDEKLRRQGILVHQLKGKVASLREKNKKIVRRNKELQRELESTRVGGGEGGQHRITRAINSMSLKPLARLGWHILGGVPNARAYYLPRLYGLKKHFDQICCYLPRTTSERKYSPRSISCEKWI